MTQTDSAAAPTSRAGRNLPAAIVVGVVLVAIVASTLVWAPWAFVAFATVLLVLAVVEVSRAMRRKSLHPATRTIALATMISVPGGYLTGLMDWGMHPSTFVMICIALSMVICLVMRVPKGSDRFIYDAAASALLVTYIPLMGMFISLLLASSQGNIRFIAIILCTVAGDTGAYLFGSLFGKHKMAPGISPGKTWEGFIGALACGAITGFCMMRFALYPDAAWVGIVLGILCAAAGALGDLVESAIKRDAGLKDMSNFLPGHGGVMDRLDSMLLAVPVGWLVLHLAFGV